jgi:hypothetical protein
MSSTTVTISKELAALVKERQKKAGFPNINEAAAALIADGLLARRVDEDHSAGLSDDELRKLLDDAETSGPAEQWNAAAVRKEVRRRHAARLKKKR